jgi:YebC/PmpR family DNA-binding regulatory protein
MAGHSKFKNIMRRKGAQDIKRGKIFTKIAREIIVAAKDGPDIQFNPKLRGVVTKARQAGLPKDRIEAAIAKGSGTLESEAFEAVRYEGYGPAGVAIIVEALTDNRNRTAPEMRAAFAKFGGNLGETGSVAFMFDQVGYIEYPKERVLDDAMLEAAIEAGADSCDTEGDTHTITCAVESFGAVRDALAKQFGDASTEKLTFLAKTHSPISGADAENLMKLVELLEDNDDVQEVHTNADISDDDAQRLSA